MNENDDRIDPSGLVRRLINDERVLLRRARSAGSIDERLKALHGLEIIERMRRRLKDRGIYVQDCLPPPDVRKANRLEPSVGLPTPYSSPATPNPSASPSASGLMDGITVRGRFVSYYDSADPEGTTYDVFDMHEVYERICVGAADDYLRRETNQWCMWNHEERCVPLGRRGVNSTWWTDKRGVNFTLNPVDTTVGRDVVAAIRAGVVTGCSFHIDVTDVDWEELPNGAAIRWVKQLNCPEGSIVYRPAYSGSRCWLDDGKPRSLTVREEAEMSRIKARLDSLAAELSPPRTVKPAPAPSRQMPRRRVAPILGYSRPG